MNTNRIIKTLQRSEDCFIQFTEEEMAQLNISPRDKFSFKIQDSGVILEKHVPVDINLDDLSKDVLVFLVEQSIEKQIPVDDVISEALGDYIKFTSES